MCGIFGFEIKFLLVGDSKAVWGRGKCTQQEMVPSFGGEGPKPRWWRWFGGTGNICREQTHQALVVGLIQQCRSQARAVSWGIWGKWGGCFTHFSAGFSQVPPTSAGPLDCVQSSCVRLNSSRDKVRLSFSRKVFEVCCQDGVLLQIINVSSIIDHPESSLTTWLCFETPVRFCCRLVPAVGTSCLGSSADAMCCWWVFFLLSWESVLLQYVCSLIVSAFHLGNWGAGKQSFQDHIGNSWKSRI